MTAEMSGTNARLWKQVEGQGVNHDIPNLTSTSSQMTPLPPSLLPLLKWMANPTTIVHLYCSESSISLLASPLADNTMPFQHAPHASAVCLHQNSSGCTHLAKCTIQLCVHSGLNLSSELDPWTVHTYMIYLSTYLKFQDCTCSCKTVAHIASEKYNFTSIN